MRRILLLLLFITGIVLWLVVLYQSKTQFPKLLMEILAVSAIGLGAGLGTRLALTKWNWLIQLGFTLACLVMGLYALGFLTDWRIGLAPLEFWRDQVDYREAAQLGGGALTALMVLSAWRRPNVRTYQPYSRSGSDGRAAVAVSGSYQPVPRTSTRTAGSGRLSSRGRAVSRPSPSAGRLVVSRPSKKSKARSGRRGVFSRKPEVQFSAYEEHKCPYCLEDVKRNDPRGVKECPVCHTLHHADCWSITGMCQVPHLTT